MTSRANEKAASVAAAVQAPAAAAVAAPSAAAPAAPAAVAGVVQSKTQDLSVLRCPQQRPRTPNSVLGFLRFSVSKYPLSFLPAAPVVLSYTNLSIE